jgi:ATP-dependent exoDNAse (exonuclease V) beta subunit
MSGGDDLASRNRIREALDVSLIVEAAAGTGKTTEMIQRIVGVLGTGRGTIDKLAAVTFTRKAAGELKLRLRQELDRKRTDATGRKKQRLEDAVVRLEEARIGTIHAFCSDILRERPVEAGLTPDFGELDEKEARNLFERVFNQWAERVMNASGAPESPPWRESGAKPGRSSNGATFLSHGRRPRSTETERSTTSRGSPASWLPWPVPRRKPRTP